MNTNRIDCEKPWGQPRLARRLARLVQSPAFRLPGRAHLLAGCAAFLFLVSGGCGPKSEPIVTGTALMQCAVDDIMSGGISSAVLIPPGSCPGHYDMRPGDVARVADCDALLLHPWQEKMPNVMSVVKASDVALEKVLVVPVPGNWMVPEAYAQALESVAEVLQAKGLASKGTAARAATRSDEARALGEELQAKLKAAGASGTVVLCQDMIAPFVEWAGFTVAGTFGRSENLSVGDVESVVELGKDRHVSLIIDNLQSGDEKLGEVLAHETGARRVLLSNFPGGLPQTETWDRAVARNVELLLEVLKTESGQAS